MRSTFTLVFGIVFVGLFASSRSVAAEPEHASEVYDKHTSEAVAWYDITKDKDGARAQVLLAKHKIQIMTVHGGGMTIIVYPADQAAGAREILARAIKNEGLEVDLIKFSPEDNRFLTLSAEGVLGGNAKP